MCHESFKIIEGFFFTTSYFAEVELFFLHYFQFVSRLAVVNLQLGKSKHKSIFCVGEGRRMEPNEKS